jgi:hypothetical protein
MTSLADCVKLGVWSYVITICEFHSLLFVFKVHLKSLNTFLVIFC